MKTFIGDTKKAYTTLKSKKNIFIVTVRVLPIKGVLILSSYKKNGLSAGNEKNLVILLGSSETIRYAP